MKFDLLSYAYGVIYVRRGMKFFATFCLENEIFPPNKRSSIVGLLLFVMNANAKAARIWIEISLKLLSLWVGVCSCLCVKESSTGWPESCTPKSSKIQIFSDFFFFLQAYCTLNKICMLIVNKLRIKKNHFCLLNT